MWLIAEYQSVSLFSLKAGQATSTGAKTVFVPTPFAIRTALLDAALRTQGVIIGPVVFEVIKSVSLALRPPEQVVVTNLFTRVQKPTRKDKQSKNEDDEADDEGSGRAMTKSIAFREYAHLAGNLGIAIGGEESALRTIESLVVQVNYFGKRGGFFQLVAVPRFASDLPAVYQPVNSASIPDLVGGQLPVAFSLGVIQVIDDWGDDLTFEKVNIYTDAKIRLGEDRARKSVILPYRLTQSSKSFSLYERS